MAGPEITDNPAKSHHHPTRCGLNLLHPPALMKLMEGISDMLFLLSLSVSLSLSLSFSFSLFHSHYHCHLFNGIMLMSVQQLLPACVYFRSWTWKKKIMTWKRKAEICLRLHIIMFYQYKSSVLMLILCSSIRLRLAFEIYYNIISFT